LRTSQTFRSSCRVFETSSGSETRIGTRRYHRGAVATDARAPTALSCPGGSCAFHRGSGLRLVSTYLQTMRGGQATSPRDRYCCKSLFASLSKSFPGYGCGALKTMWGTTLSSAKLTGDLGNAPERTSTSDYCLFPPLAESLLFGIWGLLQQYRPKADVERYFDLARSGHPSTSQPDQAHDCPAQIVLG
jgi:hypothetical protein